MKTNEAYKIVHMLVGEHFMSEIHKASYVVVYEWCFVLRIRYLGKHDYYAICVLTPIDMMIEMVPKS